MTRERFLSSESPELVRRRAHELVAVALVDLGAVASVSDPSGTTTFTVTVVATWTGNVLPTGVVTTPSAGDTGRPPPSGSADP